MRAVRVWLTDLVAVHEQFELVLLEEKQVVRLCALVVVLAAGQRHGRSERLHAAGGRVGTDALRRLRRVQRRWLGWRRERLRLQRVLRCEAARPASSAAQVLLRRSEL